MSLEALQKAALSHQSGKAADWLSGRGLAGNARIGQTLTVEQGWERAVETALGDYLEAVCVDRLEDVAGGLEGFSSGKLALVEPSETADLSAPGSLPPRR